MQAEDFAHGGGLTRIPDSRAHTASRSGLVTACISFTLHRSTRCESDSHQSRGCVSCTVPPYRLVRSAREHIGQRSDEKSSESEESMYIASPAHGVSPVVSRPLVAWMEYPFEVARCCFATDCTRGAALKAETIIEACPTSLPSVDSPLFRLLSLGDWSGLPNTNRFQISSSLL